jgi:PhoPQ-activated pathogenicity-related protein
MSAVRLACSRFSIALLLTVALVCVVPLAHAAETALDRYVRRPDSTYEWKVAREAEADGVKQWVVDLKSQTWRTVKDVDRPLWQHWLIVVKPEKVTSHKALLFIVGGANGGEAPQSAEGRTLAIAKATGSVVAELKMVPNQGLIFHNDGQSRKEDDLIAYTWDQFLKTGDETWPARLPMVKSAVRAMDCVQELLASERGGKHAIDKFVVAGGSKRGWTTWCTAAVDPRVEAAIPIVIDVLNVNESMKHHVAAYGKYSLAINDYYQHNIMQRVHDPRLAKLYEIEDPYSYRDRLTMPKFIVNSAGDEFFLPDSSQFYFDDLKGEKYLRYVPNSNHSLKDTDAVESIIAFYQTVLSGTPRPKYSWTFETSGAIRVQSETKPKEALLWQATNPEHRDFRLAVIGKAYKSESLVDQGRSTFIANLKAPPKGWTASFVELTYDVGGPFPLKLTTAVRVLPDTLPYADLDPAKAPLEEDPRK